MTRLKYLPDSSNHTGAEKVAYILGAIIGGMLLFALAAAICTGMLALALNAIGGFGFPFRALVGLACVLALIVGNRAD